MNSNDTHNRLITNDYLLMMILLVIGPADTSRLRFKSGEYLKVF
ncbi:hypothetical protein [Bradyrhizobium canariense]|nr:hypothetical protein [Bradyrhizobium canariense]